MEEKITERDFETQVQALYEARPELKGEALPREVLKACVEGKELSEAYEAYADEKAQSQNRHSAARAPVRSVTRGGSVDTAPEDPFLRGFHSEW